MNIRVKVCLISSMHSLFDDRIYWKEALSLKNFGYDVYHLGVGEADKEITSDHGIKLIMAGKKKYFDNPYIDKLFRILSFRKSIYRKLFRIAADLKADVYHFHDLQINKIGRKLKNLPHKPKLIYDVHEDYPEMILQYYKIRGLLGIFLKLYANYIRKWELKKSKNCDYIISAYPSIATKFHNYLNLENQSIIYNFTNLNPKKIIDFRAKTIDVLYCGLMNKLRAGMEILQAAKLCVKEKKDIKFLFLGPIPDPELKQSMIEYIEENGLKENINIKDPVPYNKMDEYFSKSKIGLGIFMPIKIFHTAIQVKTFEYMVYGMPIVCSNFGYINKFVTESEAGIPVNPLSPMEISNAILKILNNKVLYEKYSRNGIKAVAERYKWNIMEDKLKDIYENLLK